MNHKKVIITGAAGFIGSNLVKRLLKAGISDLTLVDDFADDRKAQNLQGIQAEKVSRSDFQKWLINNHSKLDFIFHLGARTDTAEFNFEVLDKLNLSYSRSLWELCTQYNIPLLYASSAATYGLGENGFSDSHELVDSLKPLNPYGLSKQLFDQYVLQQASTPPFWAGLKFFNVYGPHEQHKGRMASVVYHAYNQIRETGKMKLFKSHIPEYRDGEQLRDFIYVDDVVDVCMFFYRHRKNNGIYNLGSGKAATFNELANAVFESLDIPPAIQYIPIPEDIRDKYQYFTEAKMGKLRAAGYSRSFTPLKEGVMHYIRLLGQ